MILKQLSDYVGRFRQPIQKPDVDTPTMFAVADANNFELDLILLTPGTFEYACKFIKRFNGCKYRIFIPSLKYEFVSDIFNLYMTMKDIVNIKWVFPDEINHYDFSKGQIKSDSYTHEMDNKISISYVKTEIEGVYDIIARTTDGVHYFCQYLTEEHLKELMKSTQYAFIHLPISYTLYGGLNYIKALKVNRRYKKKLIPHSFVSIEQYYDMMNDAYIEPIDVSYGKDEDDDGIPDDITGDIDDEDIFNILNDSYDRNGEDDE